MKSNKLNTILENLILKITKNNYSNLSYLRKWQKFINTRAAQVILAIRFTFSKQNKVKQLGVGCVCVGGFMSFIAHMSTKLNKMR